MRKLALAGIVSIFATVALSGCMSAPEEDVTPAADDTTPVVEEGTDYPAPEEGALYNYNDEALEFSYPTAWIMGEGEFNFPDTPATVKHVQWAYTGDGELNKHIWVEFRSPMLETAYMGWALKETKDLSKDGLNVEMKILEEDKEFLAEVGDERDPNAPDEMSSITVITDTVNGTSYQFSLVAPAKDFDKYNAFVETAVETFEIYTEGGGGIADCAANATVSEKLANFDNCSVDYEYGKDLIYGCNDEAKDLMAKMHAGKIKMLNTLVPNSTTLVLYKTENPDKLTKEEAKAIVQPCGELGSYQILDAADDYIILGYPNCSGGALPDPELQPEQYAVWEDCIVVEKELKEYFEL